MPFPFRQESLARIRRRVGFLMFGRTDFLYGTATAGSASSLTLTEAARFPTDTLKGRIQYIVSGTGAGQSRLISGNTQGTGALTPAPNWTTAPDATSVVEIWPDLITPDEVNEKINLAILEVSDLVQIKTESTNPTLDATRKIVTIPTTLLKVTGLSYLRTADSLPVFYKRQDYLDPASTEPQFVLGPGGKLNLTPAIPSGVAGASITVSGYRLPVELTADSTLCEVRPDYLVLKAAAYIEMSTAGGPQVDPEQHSGRAANWLAQARMIEPRMAPIWDPNTMEV